MRQITATAREQMREIQQGAAEIISEEDLFAKLEKSYQEDKPLIVKLGADPSRPDIHIGHSVVINKLRLLQDFGHSIKFIIGDFTGRIGDPTGKSKTRPELSDKEIYEYAETYKEQIFKILHPTKTSVVFNGEWLSKFTPVEFIKMMAQHTMQQILARDDFTTRYKEQSPIYLHEFLYPLLQGYDSVHLKSDIELGGTDQKFNLLMGREMQKQRGQRPQSILMMPILEGLDGVQKMSKSLDNYIGISEPPKDIFGKTMSISDEHMLRFYDLLSRRGAEYVAQLKADLKSGKLHPMEAKKSIAQELVEQFWGKEAGEKARAEFEAIFSNKTTPTDLPLHQVKTVDGEADILGLCVELEFCPSRGEARRVLKQNGIKLDSLVLSQEKVLLEKGKEYVFRVGKIKMVKIIST